MRCHYEVLDIERSAEADTIKKAYRRAALKWHPDKHVGNEDEATERFKEVSSAYEVLSDPQERRWYDDHREAILRGGDGTASGGGDDDESPLPNLWKYFNPSCYNSSNFYEVYTQVFSDIDAMEYNSGERKVPSQVFGNNDSPHNEVIAFYNFWSDWSSTLTFAWEDTYDTREAPNRWVRRKGEDENRKSRKEGKKKYNDTVRALVKYVKRIDPRWRVIEGERMARKMAQEEERVNVLRKKAEDKRLQKEALLRAMEEDDEEKERRQDERARAFLLGDEDYTTIGHGRRKGGRRKGKLEDDYGDSMGVAIVDDNKEDGFGSNSGSDDEAGDSNVNSSTMGSSINHMEVNTCNDTTNNINDDVDDVILYCESCRKNFKTVAQLDQHLASKVHRKRQKELIKGQNKEKETNGNIIKTRSVENIGISSVTVSEPTVIPPEEALMIVPGGGDFNSNPNNPPLPPTALDSDVDSSIVCATCGLYVHSRNQLFNHLRDSGHAMLVANSEGKTKKKVKKKGRR
jgi:DnaJ homolog subfamily A member 5